ncbi:hypothetical protein CKAH01_02310 [Colletotrichum kahawae]|uniref:Uncharacterized protein n=1 Tax=Colletotrichum kahawae TaxID=34407 RepID=A0AAD9Y055_COLKA|nr:hypothetical protein CKAH01_02310 [Colletotrichum kahawae]
MYCAFGCSNTHMAQWQCPSLMHLLPQPTASLQILLHCLLSLHLYFAPTSASAPQHRSPSFQARSQDPH